MPLFMGASIFSSGHGQTLLFITVSIWKMLQSLWTSFPISRSMICIGFVSGFMMDCSTFHCKGVWWCLMLRQEPRPTRMLFHPPFMEVKFTLT